MTSIKVPIRSPIHRFGCASCLIVATVLMLGVWWSQYLHLLRERLAKLGDWEATRRWNAEVELGSGSILEDVRTNSSVEHYRVYPVVSSGQQAILWNRARKQLGLPVDREDVLDDRNQLRYANNFYTLCSLNNRMVLGGRALYVRIPKNGNDNIRCNLLSWPGHAEDVSCSTPEGGLRLAARGVKIWTFTRHPISRFVSGYSEVEYRRRGEEDVQELLRFPVGTKERFREYLVSILSGRRIKEMYHTFSQSFIGVEFPYVTAGRIENMDTDWTSLQAWLGISDPHDFKLDCNVHPTTADPLGAAAAAREALEEDPALLRALCILLFPDFMNFGYELPDACKGMEELSDLWPYMR